MPARRLPARRLRRAAAVAGRDARRSLATSTGRLKSGAGMNLHAKLSERAAQGKPLRIGLIGAGKFGTMYLAQVPKTPGVHLVGIADLAPAHARTNLARVGWAAERYPAASLDAALTLGATHLGDD